MRARSGGKKTFDHAKVRDPCQLRIADTELKLIPITSSGVVADPGAPAAETSYTLGVTPVVTAKAADGSTVVVDDATVMVMAAPEPPPAPAGSPTPPEGASNPISIIADNGGSNEVGFSIEVTLTIPDAVEAIFTGFWKYGSESAGDAPHWYDLGTLSANAGDPRRTGTGYRISGGGKSITVTLVDELRGDNDGVANGEIIDPGVVIVEPLDAAVDPIVLDLGMTDSSDPVQAGDRLTYTIDYANDGSSYFDATYVELAATYDANVVFVSANPPPARRKPPPCGARRY